jgi:hypothetical protein
MMTPEQIEEGRNRAMTELAHVIAPLSENEEQFDFLCRQLAITYYNNDVYEYADKLRIARCDRPDTVQAYLDTRRKGCCGSYDRLEIFEDGTKEVAFLIGFNYGH